MSEMKDELEQQIEEAEASDDAIRGIKYTMRMRATIIASSTLFEMLILMLIILNGVLLGVQTYEKFAPLTNQALDATQRVCLSIFVFSAGRCMSARCTHAARTTRTQYPWHP